MSSVRVEAASKMQNTDQSVKQQNKESNATDSALNDESTMLKAISLSVVNLDQLPLDVWEYLFSYISVNDIITLSSVCKKIQWIVHTVKTKFNLKCNYYLNIKCLLNFALSSTCSSVNINYCYWLEPGHILQIISKTKLLHLHVIDCNLDEDCIRAIFHLNLESLSMSYSKDWISCFREHTRESIPFLQKLTTLKLFVQITLYSSGPGLSIKPVLFDIYFNVLRHCKELEHLKVLDYSDQRCFDFEKQELNAQTTEFLSQTTPLPKLQSLKVYLHYENLSEQDVVSFLEIVLKNKVIPLEHVDFGTFTWQLLDNGILRHPLILHEKDALILKSHKDNMGSCRLLVDEKSSILIWPEIYKRICFQFLDINKFEWIVDKISTSGKFVREIVIRNCRIYGNALKGIQSLAINCPQITVLDLTVLNWHESISEDVFSRTLVYCDYEGVAKNDALLEALTNFKNLTELFITPLMLLCDYYKCGDLMVGGRQKIMPFWKVTKSCCRLRKLHIENVDPIYVVVHMDSIYDIAYCKNLKVLILIDFKIRGNTDFLLQQITKGCTQLKELRIQDVVVVPIRNPKLTALKFIATDSLCFTKDLKKLRFDLHYSSLNKTFVDDLCASENLEKIHFMLYDWNDEVVQYLIDSLPKMKNLFLFLIQFDQNTSFDERFKLVFQKIKDEKVAFYGSVNRDGTCRASHSYADNYYFDI